MVWNPAAQRNISVCVHNWRRVYERMAWKRPLRRDSYSMCWWSFLCLYKLSPWPSQESWHLQSLTRKPAAAEELWELEVTKQITRWSLVSKWSTWLLYAFCLLTLDAIRLHCIIYLDHFNLILLRHIIGDIEWRLIFRSFYVSIRCTVIKIWPTYITSYQNFIVPFGLK